jgi:DNA-directed RNA polymerase specialized sigma24 family protein
MPPATPSARFPTTAWSCIQAAQDPGHPQHEAAMTRLMTDYWRPAFYFLRALGHPVDRAKDLTQGFFLQFLEKDWIRPADPARGHFHDFLLTLLQRFAYDKTRRLGAQEKFEQQHVSLDSLVQDSDRTYQPPARETPEEVFHKQWKADLLAAVRRNLQAIYEGGGKPDKRQPFEIFAAYYFVDRLEDQPTQEALAARFGVSRDQVRYALEVVAKRYRHLLRQELRDQGYSEEELDGEIRKLL